MISQYYWYSLYCIFLIIQCETNYIVGSCRYISQSRDNYNYIYNIIQTDSVHYNGIIAHVHTHTYLRIQFAHVATY